MSVATTYAKALFESLSDVKKNGNGSHHAPVELATQVEQDLRAFFGMIGTSRDARVSLFSPVTTRKEKQLLVSALAKKAGMSDLTERFLRLLAAHNRLSHWEPITEAFADLAWQAQGGIRGDLVVAEEMATEDLRALSDAFSKKLGKKIAFRVRIDAEVLAGVRVTVQGVTYDGTLQSQLLRMREKIHEAARQSAGAVGKAEKTEGPQGPK